MEQSDLKKKAIKDMLVDHPSLSFQRKMIRSTIDYLSAEGHLNNTRTIDPVLRGVEEALSYSLDQLRGQGFTDKMMADEIQALEKLRALQGDKMYGIDNELNERECE